MTVVQTIDRRNAQRYKATFDIRFSINGGPEVVSNTLNFTSRSLAIRSDMPARRGDQVAVRFGSLPELSGKIVRTFPEGFAATLCQKSLDMIARADDRSAIKILDAHQPADFAENTATSPFIDTKSETPARALLTSGFGFEPGYNRHFLSIITEDPAAFECARNVWVSAEGTRWIASGLRFEQRKTSAMAVTALNDWQTYMGAAYGLKISIIDTQMRERSIEIAAGPIAAHLESLTPFKIAVSA